MAWLQRAETRHYKVYLGHSTDQMSRAWATCLIAETSVRWLWLQMPQATTDGERSLHTEGSQVWKCWRVACLTVALAACYGAGSWAASVSTQAFGRYEIVLQEGVSVVIGEILGTVRRQTGVPDYPLVLSTQERVLELSILGPGNRPIRLASAPLPRSRGTGAGPARFVVERSVRQDETLTLWLRQVRAPQQVGLAVDLRQLERLLEGQR